MCVYCMYMVHDACKYIDTLLTMVRMAELHSRQQRLRNAESVNKTDKDKKPRLKAQKIHRMPIRNAWALKRLKISKAGEEETTVNGRTRVMPSTIRRKSLPSQRTIHQRTLCSHSRANGSTMELLPRLWLRSALAYNFHVSILMQKRLYLSVHVLLRVKEIFSRWFTHVFEFLYLGVGLLIFRKKSRSQHIWQQFLCMCI